MLYLSEEEIMNFTCAEKIVYLYFILLPNKKVFFYA